jgi:plasmid maintenance system antidote protein VapI
MSALAATSVYESGASICSHSQIAKSFASPEYRKAGNYLSGEMPQVADMAESTDKNGGPNYLRAWMEYRGIKGVDLAEALGGNVTPGMVSDLVNSNRALSAKWLRRIAPHLDTTPGMLLDHDPNELDRDIVSLWSHASSRERRQLLDLARVVVNDRTGTDDG